METNSFSKVCHALNMAVSVLKSFKVPDANADKFAAFISDLESALETPRRNCDVGTAEEQDERFRDFCPKYTNGGSTSDCEGCKLSGTACYECALVWAQMPYGANEKGEVDDTNG